MLTKVGKFKNIFKTIICYINIFLLCGDSLCDLTITLSSHLETWIQNTFVYWVYAIFLIQFLIYSCFKELGVKAKDREKSMNITKTIAKWSRSQINK